MQALSELRDSFVTLQSAAEAFFASAGDVLKHGPSMFSDSDSDAFWRRLSEEDQKRSEALQREALKLVGALAAYVKRSPLTSEADERDLKSSAKALRAALRLRRYRSWDPEIINDEDVVLGIRPAGQSDSEPAQAYEAQKYFFSAMETLVRIYELIEATPEPSAALAATSAAVATKYRPNTVFVMMWLDKQQPFLEDIYNTIKACCTSFGLNAIRADEIEHEQVITERILSEIKTSEFLIADLTGERPSVYYEIGYAHSLGKRVIMYRQEGTRVHFDLAAYNCPEYKNLTDLKERLTRRLADATNRRQKSGN